MNPQEIATKAFEDFLKDFGIERAEFRGRTIFKFETDNMPVLLGSLTDCHEKLYRVILTIHIATIPDDERIEAIKKAREFTAKYLDRATDELIEALEKGITIGKSFGIVK